MKIVDLKDKTIEEVYNLTSMELNISKHKLHNLMTETENFIYQINIKGLISTLNNLFIKSIEKDNDYFDQLEKSLDESILRMKKNINDIREKNNADEK